jgi:hypothetical protein
MGRQRREGREEKVEKVEKVEKRRVGQVYVGVYRFLYIGTYTPLYVTTYRYLYAGAHISRGFEDSHFQAPTLAGLHLDQSSLLQQPQSGVLRATVNTP